MIQIALADDHKLFAKGLEGLIEEHDGFLVKGLFPNGKELLEFLDETNVDIVLTDLNMPIIDGFGVLRHCKKHHPQLKVIVLSMYDDEKIFKECIKLGAEAFILKDADPDELIFTINEVHEGRYLIDFQRVIQQADLSPFFDAFREKYRLSKRETQILRMISDGMLNREIADNLSLSVQTIETHRKNIHQKLQVTSRVELIKKVNEMHL
ncbi:response regulator transcription factor [Algoriphagus boritolerans]|uniref:Two component transcriptional regulator, LuxR family n=1 Tax=Algoriphagus boritolerans DSM 17298 = JCM 18970 TaxID=1120964 RepID=A0A1H5YVX7_9BACT|nr:response regulator transcription factor [Algoriphagus boritolerans]SEG28174.1 two component transcriptional regulator, LuxR family [Algoriphagus boritolerans DSM 17298 = JCM 18970]